MSDSAKGSHNEHTILKQARKDDDEGMVKYAIDLPEEGYEKDALDKTKGVSKDVRKIHQD